MPRRSARIGTVCAAALCLLCAAGLLAARDAGEREQHVLIVPIHGEIDRVQGAFLHRALSGAKGKYDAVIFDIDTPGGLVGVAEKMSEEMAALSPPTRTIAYIPTGAFSAGALLSMSCDKIYMGPRAKIGAAHGWVPGPDGLPVELPKPVEEKFTSALRAVFRALAENKGYPPAIAEGMVDETLGIKQVRYDGQVRYMTDQQVSEIEKDPLKAEKLKVLETVSPAGKLITFTAQEAVKYNVATAVENSLDGVLAAAGLGGALTAEVGQNWGDKVVAILTTPQVFMLLILIGFGGIWLELKMPGFGVPGTIAVIAFVLLFGAQFLVGNANALEVLLFLVGAALLAIELFVTPGFGFVGGLGIALVFVALLLATQSFVLPRTPWEVSGFEVNLLATVGGIAGSLLILVIAIFVLPRTAVANRITLQSQLKVEEGFGSGVQAGGALVGKVGVVVSPLRPAGKMEIGATTYSVVSEGDFVELGRKARVLSVDGPKIVVQALPTDKPKEPELA